MNQRLYSLLRLRPGEAGIVFVMGLLLLINSMALQVSGIVGISGFLSEGGVNNFLLVLLVDYLLILLTAGLQTLIVDRFDRISLMRWMAFGFALVFIALRLLFTFSAPGWLNYSLIYLIAEQQWLYFPLIFWILAHDIFEMSQTTRLFPLIASWGFIGKILGIGVAAVSPGLLGGLGIATEEVLSINILLYLLAYILISRGFGKIEVAHTPHRKESIRQTLTEGWKFVREVPSFRYLTTAVFALALADTIIEFRFLVVSDAIFTTVGSYQRFYSFYRLGVTIAALVIQGLVTSRLIAKVTLKNTFIVFPAICVLGIAWMLGAPGIISAVGAMVLVKLSRDTVDESTRKSFQALVPEERRGRVSLFIDSFIPAIGTIAGCLIGGVIVVMGLQSGSTTYHNFYLAAAGVASLVAVWAVLQMRKVYDSSLLNWRLKRRRRSTDLLDKLDF